MNEAAKKPLQKQARCVAACGADNSKFLYVRPEKTGLSPGENCGTVERNKIKF